MTDTDRLPYDLSRSIEQALCIARLLSLACGDATNPLAPNIVLGVADALVTLLERAAQDADALHDVALVPIRSVEDWQRLRTLRAEIEATRQDPPGG